MKQLRTKGFLWILTVILGLCVCLTGVAATAEETETTATTEATAETETTAVTETTAATEATAETETTAATEITAATMAAAPAVPTISKALAVSENSVRLSWAAVPGATGYYVYRGVAGGSYSFVGGTQKTYYVDTGLTKNTVYYYKLVSYSKDSNGVITKSKLSNYKSIKMVFKPTTLLTMSEPDPTDLQETLNATHMVVYSEKRDGLYIYGNYVLRFFDFSDSSWSVVYSDRNYFYYDGRAFLTEDALYLGYDKSVKVLDLESRSIVKNFSVKGIDWISAIGADAKGRIYVGGEQYGETVTAEDGVSRIASQFFCSCIHRTERCCPPVPMRLRLPGSIRLMRRRDIFFMRIFITGFTGATITKGTESGSAVSIPRIRLSSMAVIRDCCPRISLRL